MDSDARKATLGKVSKTMDAMDIMSPFSAFLPVETEVGDYVKWQGSQTACLALNQLIKTSASESDLLVGDVGNSRGWQRQPSFDQIPGFSSLSTNDTVPSSSSLPKPTTTAPKSVHARPRPSGARSRSPAITPDLTNLSMPVNTPAQFFDILKGISARLDENAGVPAKSKPGSSLGPTRTKDGKRMRRDRSDLQAGRAKKIRVDTSHPEESHQVVPNDKGKGRARFDATETPACQSVVDDSSPALKERKFIGAHDKGTRISHEQSNSVRPTTTSQNQMPPPPAPLKHPTSEKIIPTPVISAFNQPPIPQSGLQTKEATLPHTRPQRPDRVPQLHSLLLNSPPTAPSSSSSSSPNSIAKPQLPARAAPPQLSRHESAPPKPRAAPPKETKPQIQPLYPPSKPLESNQIPMPPPTPNPASSQSSRPPALGMRRTHTFPSSAMVTSLQKNGALPTRQKAFKPPLLSGSQSGSQIQRHDQLSVNKATVVSNAGIRVPQQRPYQYDSPQRPTDSYGSTSSASPNTSSSSSTSASASTALSTPSSGSSYKLTSAKTATRSTLAQSASTSWTPATVAAAPEVIEASVPVDMAVIPSSLPEPSDGDGDSSFGDMSFDMDALEEMMRQYD